jgi:DNA-binding PadR family transcriptional regulator
MTRRPSPQTLAVLAALAADPAAWRHGYDLGTELGMKAGTLYPILMRLSDRGQLEQRWEEDPPVGRPARHLYRLSGEGRAFAAEAGAEAAAEAEAEAAGSGGSGDSTETRRPRPLAAGGAA